MTIYMTFHSSHIHFMFFLHIHSFLTLLSFFFFNDTATTEIYTLSLHDALPISVVAGAVLRLDDERDALRRGVHDDGEHEVRSEEHTSELQSQSNLVCRLLLEKKKYRLY